MGMYTCFMLNCRVKKEYRKCIRRLNEGEIEDINEWNGLVNEMPFIKEYAEMSRASMIPFGMLSAYNEDKFGPRAFNKYNACLGEWNFLCDLKNYSGEIEIFIETVLPHLCERIYFCAYWYEENAHPKIVTEEEILGQDKGYDWYD